MPVASRVKRDTYIDSLILMRAATKVRDRPRVMDFVILMGTPQNKEMLSGTNL